MYNTYEIYDIVFTQFVFHSLVCRGRFDTRQMMLYIAKEMIIRGEY